MQSISASISPFSLIRLFLKYELCSCLTPGHVASQDAASARMDQFDGKETTRETGRDGGRGVETFLCWRLNSNTGIKQNRVVCVRLSQKNSKQEAIPK